MRKLPHYMDSGFHKAARNHSTANDRFDKNYNLINWGETKGKIEEQKNGYTKMGYGDKK